jgi:serine/threonine protein kinase/formylglycine-generating enzyme required for sulfatase activity
MTGAERRSVEAGLAEYLARQRAGTPCPAEALAGGDPELAQQLSSHASTLAALDRLIDLDRGEQKPIPELNDYRLVRWVGRGGMGSVYLAEHLPDGRLVALKLIERSLTQSPAAVARFVREAELAASLRHPNLVAVFDSGSTDHYAYYAMEFVPGVTLARAIAQLRESRAQGQGDLDLHDIVPAAVARLGQELDLELGTASGARDAEARESYFASAARIVAETADALAYLHARGIVHRDVKPENILLDGAVAPLLTDFGLARDAEGGPMTRTGALLGTPQYMSPEMATLGAKAVDHRTDVYSLGVTLYELLTLRAPHQAKSTHELLRKIAVETPPAPRLIAAGVPRDLETIALKAIEKDPRRRYSSAQDFAEDLRRFLRFERILARPPSWWRRAGRFARRHRLVAGLAVVLAGAAVAWWAMVGHFRGQEHRRLVADAAGLIEHGRAASAASALRLLERARAIRSDAATERLYRLAQGERPVAFSAEPAAAVVFVRSMDDDDGEVGVIERLGGTTPDAPRLTAWLPVGEYIAIVDGGDAGYGELRLEVTWRDLAPTLHAPLRPDAESSAGMVEVPAGRYRIGYNPPKAAGLILDRAEEVVAVEAFLIDRCEVSNADYERFVRATGIRAPWGSKALGPDARDLPVAGVTWDEALAYAQWAGKRLPSEVEWEVAARGPDARLYAFGDTFDATKANLASMSSPGLSTGRPLPVSAATSDVSPFGVLHMTGNVREWVFDLWRSPKRPTERELALPTLGQRVTCGSSWQGLTSPASARASHRQPRPPDETVRDIGFRCAKSKPYWRTGR